MEMSWCLNLHWDLFVDFLAMQSGEEMNGGC